MAGDDVVNAMDSLILQGHSVFSIVLYSHPGYNFIILRCINFQTFFHLGEKMVKVVLSADLDLDQKLWRSRPFRSSSFCGASP
jgi:hypothetical protein